MSLTTSAQTRDETQFNRGAWAVLLIAALLIGMGIFTIIYRYLLPTDGWSYQSSVTNQVLAFDVNLVGARSELRAGDILTAVNGIAAEQILKDVYHQTPPNWRVGGRMTYNIQRDGKLLAVDIPVVAWTPAAVWHSLSDDAGTLASDAGAFAMLAVTLFTFLRRTGNAAARLLLLIGAFLTAEALSGLLPSGVSEQFDALANALNSLWFQLFVTALAPMVLTFTLVFPRPKAIVQRHASRAWLPFVWGGALQAGLILLQLLIWSGARQAGLIEEVIVAAFFSMLFMLILSIACLVHSAYSMRDAVSRAQIRWALGGFGLGILCLPLMFLIDAFGLTTDPLFKSIQSILGELAAPIIGISLAIAVLRYRLFDIDVIIRRTVVYGLLTGLLAGIYFGGVVVLQQVFVAITGQRSELAIILSTLAIAALFVPLRGGIQAVIDRRFFRRKYDAAKMLESFAVTVRDEVDATKLVTRLIDVVDETLQPIGITLWLNRELAQDRVEREK
jgi:hypothetical protein